MGKTLQVQNSRNIPYSDITTRCKRASRLKMVLAYIFPPFSVNVVYIKGVREVSQSPVLQIFLQIFVVIKHDPAFSNKLCWYIINSSGYYLFQRQSTSSRLEWLVVLGLTALRDSISVYIGPSPSEKERERRSDR